MNASPTPWQQREDEFTAALRLASRPVSVTFLDTEPAGIDEFTGTEPSGCSFWRLAAKGRVFYTLPSDHFNCAVGAYTLNIPLSPEREKETEQTLQMMFGVGYIRPEDVPGNSTLAEDARGHGVRSAGCGTRGARRGAFCVPPCGGHAAE